MRPLPAEAMHLPFGPGPYRMGMDLVSIPEAAWFELDERYLPDMAQRRRLLAEAHADVFAALPGSGPARAEALDLMMAALTAHHPDRFSRNGSAVRNHLTSETFDVAAIDPLELAGRLVQEDLCLVEAGEQGPILTAAVLCFPSRWRLSDKIGKPLSAVHAPVPFYADRLAAPVDRLMGHLKPGRIASRLNWSLLDDPALFQPDGRQRPERATDITAENAGSRVFLRVERQTLRRLPQTGAVLFGIRVHVHPLANVIDRPQRAGALAEAVRALPEEILLYKSVPPFRAALLAWLDAHGG